jgi:cardiolipin synthase
MHEPVGSRAVLTVPNILSAIRIACIPLFAALILKEETTYTGLVLFAVVLATDWVDGYVARRTGQISELGKILDPVADRLAIACGIVALVVRGAFPLWAAALIVGRDLVALVGGAIALAGRGVRVPVRPLGKIATFSLMLAIGGVSWGNLDFAPAAAASVMGWTCFAVGIVEYYAVAFLYAGDLRRATAR